MKMIYKTLCFFILINLCNFLYAQTTSQWEAVGLSASGNNTYKGVEMFYQFLNCNGEFSCVLKFVNNNDYEVEIEWVNALFTNDMIWHEDIGNNNIIKIEGNSEISGSCNSLELFFPVRNIVNENPDKIIKYRAFSFNIISK